MHLSAEAEPTTGWTPHQIIASDWQKPLRPNRGGYTVTMREDFGARECLQRLSGSAPPSRAALHVGWGSFRNLDIVAARKSGAALLLDINAHQFRVWRAVLAALTLADNPRDFVEAVLPLLPKRPKLRQFVGDTKEWLMLDAAREDSWLAASRPERYRHVRKLAIAKMIAIGCLDMRGGSSGDKVFAGLAAALDEARRQGWRSDTLYVSNVPWMLAQPRGFFGECHSDFLHASSGRTPVARVKANLALIAPLFTYVMCAIHRAPASRLDDLQWETRLLTPDEFLSDPLWSEWLEERASMRQAAR